jgi:hypothetical protein
MTARQEKDRRQREAETAANLVRRFPFFSPVVLCVHFFVTTMQAHMVHAINSDLLSENPQQGRDSTGRIVSTDRFKGLRVCNRHDLFFAISPRLQPRVHARRAADVP